MVPLVRTVHFNFGQLNGVRSESPDFNRFNRLIVVVVVFLSYALFFIANTTTQLIDLWFFCWF